MNPPYAWVLHREAARVMLPLRSKIRRRLEVEFDVLSERPFVDPHEVSQADDGREIRFLWRDPFWIGFALDHAVRQVRIVSLTRESPMSDGKS